MIYHVCSWQESTIRICIYRSTFLNLTLLFIFTFRIYMNQTKMLLFEKIVHRYRYRHYWEQSGMIINKLVEEKLCRL